MAPTATARTTLGAVVCALSIFATDLSANDALDFWREEYARTNRQGSGPPAQEDRATEHRARPALRLTVRPRRESAGLPGGQRYCVRTCDGYYFPLTRARLGDDQELCRALCPNAATEVFALAGGEESIEHAVSARGKAYTSLAAAFLYRTSLKPGCSCGRPAAVRTALLHDPTLAAGDIVMTEQGVRVFAGGGGPPFHDRDFIAFRKARGLSPALVTYLSLIDRPFHKAELKQTLDANPERTRAAAATPLRLADQR